MEEIFGKHFSITEPQSINTVIYKVNKTEKEFLDKKNRAFAVQKGGIYREPLAYPLFKAPFSWLRQADIKAYWHSAF